MAIATRDQLINAMANNSSRVVIDKANVGSQAPGNFVSMWRATGQPTQGAVPAAAAVCDQNTAGGIRFNQQTDPATSYLTILESLTSNTAMTLEMHDRLVAMGGLSGTVTTAQSVGIDLSTLLSTSNIAARIGDANYSDVQWWLEWYSVTGSTAVTATVAVTYNDGTIGTLSVSIAATRPAGLMIPLNGLIPALAANKYICAVTSVQLSANTGTAGNFGVTATRYRAANFMPLSNARYTSDWAGLGLPEIVNASCLFAVMLTSTTSSGTLRATGKITHG